MVHVSSLIRLALASSVFLAVGCQPEIVPEPYVPTDAHDAYRHALTESGLIETALGREWEKAGEAALRSPVDIETPFKETVYVDERRAFATGYRFAVVRGQRTEVQLSVQPASDWRIYLDLFREPEPTSSSTSGPEPPIHVASGGEGDLRLAFEPRKNGTYRLRVHSELLRGGSCTIEIRSVASLEFPVSGHDTGSIGSSFGAPREAGRRSHHGVDIFAPRHTVVVATSSARVRRVDEWKLGGNVVWLEDPERNLRLYFAHLQTQDVEEGVWVRPGDRIGTVGNSGNARTTPPHLHFGVYVRGEGPIDPYPFLFQPKRRPAEVQVDLEKLGHWLRIRADGIELASRPGGETLRELPRHTPLFVAGGAGKSYRVVLPNGLIGYVSEKMTEPLTTVTTLELAEATSVLDRPAPDAAVMQRLEGGTHVNVRARFGSYDWVDSEHQPMWIRTEAPSPTAAAP